MLAAVVVASTTLLAAPGKKKKKEAEPKAQPVVLQSASDTLSYAAGQMLTRGLMDFIVKEYKVDTAYMAGFISGTTMEPRTRRSLAPSTLAASIRE